MVRVNGNYDNKGNYFFTKEIVKKEIAEEKVEKAVVEEKTAFKERGEELLSAGMFGKTLNLFTLNERLDNETADELSEMFAMAGISHRLPTATEYARIAGSTKASLAQIAPFETEMHVEMLFSNTKVMDLLAEETTF